LTRSCLRPLRGSNFPKPPCTTSSISTNFMQ
jgi:hypothetical protein